jgi:hypothetical protein
MIQKIKSWYHGLSDQWRATLRTFMQSVVGGVLVAALSLLNSVLNLLNNQPVDLAEDLSNASKALGIVVVSAVISLVTFVWNKVGTAPKYEG